MLCDVNLSSPDRFTTHVLATTEVEEPRDLVKHGHNKAQTLLLVQLLAQIVNLVAEALAGILVGLYNDLLARASRSFCAPYQIHQVLVDGLVLAALFLDLLSKFTGVRRGDNTRIDADNLASLSLIGSPLLDRGHVLDALLQQLPIAVQLLLGLVEVASVGREGSLVVRDDGVASGASEATDVC